MRRMCESEETDQLERTLEIPSTNQIFFFFAADINIISRI